MSNFGRFGTFIGLWLLAVAAVVAGVAYDSEIGRSIAEVLAIGGTMSILTDRICREIGRVNRPADHAWQEGFEIGHDKGWREGFAAAQPTATVTRLEDRRAVDGETA